MKFIIREEQPVEQIVNITLKPDEDGDCSIFFNGIKVMYFKNGVATTWCEECEKNQLLACGVQFEANSDCIKID